MSADLIAELARLHHRMREPTLAMELRGMGAPGGFADRYRAAIDTEISIAEGGKDG